MPDSKITYWRLSDGYTFNVFNSLQAINRRNESGKQGKCFGIEKPGQAGRKSVKMQNPVYLPGEVRKFAGNGFP